MIRLVARLKLLSLILCTSSLSVYLSFSFVCLSSLFKCLGCYWNLSSLLLSSFVKLPLMYDAYCTFLYFSTLSTPKLLWFFSVSASAPLFISSLSFRLAPTELCFEVETKMLTKHLHKWKIFNFKWLGHAQQKLPKIFSLSLELNPNFENLTVMVAVG